MLSWIDGSGGVLPELLCVDLVDGRAVLDVGTFCLLGMRAGQKNGTGAEVVGPDFLSVNGVGLGRNRCR